MTDCVIPANERPEPAQLTARNELIRGKTPWTRYDGRFMKPMQSFCKQPPLRVTLRHDMMIISEN